MANSTAPAARAQARPEIKTRSILLVEDEEAHVELIRRAFVESPEEWLIHHAATFNEAIQWLAENESTPPSLILADYRLPDGKGIDIIEKAKKLGDAGGRRPGYHLNRVWLRRASGAGSQIRRGGLCNEDC